MTCKSCGADLTSGARFCDECGARTSVACVSCGTELRPGAKFCSECGASQGAVAAQPVQVSERKVTSVLFGDLVGFTTLSEQRDKEDVRELLSDYFAQCRRIVARYGGTIEKFIGDAVMAVWGVPTAHEDDAERAVRAGLELVRAIETLGEVHSGLALRVGIVTGEVAVTVGAVYEGMVAGDAVNTAARVQSVAAPGQVWVDENTRLLTSGAITYVDVGSHQLKGKAEPMPLWAVRAVVAAVGGVQRADGLEAPLTGRARELRVIKELFHGVEETGRPALVLVNGEPGVGKSRLAWEFEKYVDGLATPIAWHSTRCLAYGDGVAFWPIAEAVRGRLGLVESDLDGDPAAALDEWLARCVHDETEAAWLRPRVLALLGRVSAGGYDREDLFAAWRTFFERAREARPAVSILVDDAQHADDGTMHFLEHLVGNSDQPLFVALMARPELLRRWPALATNRRATVLHLATLETREMAALLDGLVVGLPAEVRDGLVERAQGVPLYAMETVRSLIDRDLVVPRGGVYVLPDPASVDLAAIGAPASLQALVAARLDGLPAAERRVVADASVLGATFTREAIAALADGVDDLDGVLAALARAEILGTVASRLSAEYGQYRFVQAVVRQVAYGTQSRRDRKARHLAVAAYFETVPDPGADYAPVLAQHYLDAIDASGPADADLPVLRAAAAGHLARSAARARALGASADALRYLEAALEIAPEDGRPRLHVDAAWAALEAADGPKAESHARTAMEDFDLAGDELGAAEAAAALATTLTVLAADFLPALGIAMPRWEALRDVRGAEEVLLQLARAIGSARSRMGESTVEISMARVEIADAIGDRAALADALVGLATANLGRSISLFELLARAAVEIGREEQRPRIVSKGLGMMGVLIAPNDLAEAVQLLEEAADEDRRGGSDAYNVAINSMNLALRAAVAGRLDRAAGLLDAVPEIADSRVMMPLLDAAIASIDGRPRRLPSVPAQTYPVDDENLLAFALATEMFEARERGDWVAATESGMRAVTCLLNTVRLSDDTIFIWPGAVESALAAGDRDTVSRLLAAVDDELPGLVGHGYQAHRKRFAGLVAMADGPESAVEENLRAAVTGFTEWGSPLYAARTRAELADWLERAGRGEEAADLRAAAVDYLRSVGANGWLAELGLDATPNLSPA